MSSSCPCPFLDSVSRPSYTDALVVPPPLLVPHRPQDDAYSRPPMPPPRPPPHASTFVRPLGIWTYSLLLFLSTASLLLRAAFHVRFLRFAIFEQAACRTARNLGVGDRTRGDRGRRGPTVASARAWCYGLGESPRSHRTFRALREAATPRAAATRRGVGRRTAGRGVAMAETALSHGTIMHIHELQALGAEAVGKSVRVLGA